VLDGGVAEGRVYPSAELAAIRTDKIKTGPCLLVGITIVPEDVSALG
jgi:hypothetical protein